MWPPPWAASRRCACNLTDRGLLAACWVHCWWGGAAPERMGDLGDARQHRHARAPAHRAPPRPRRRRAAGPSSPRSQWPLLRGTTADAAANALMKGSPRGVTPTQSNAALMAAAAAVSAPSGPPCRRRRGPPCRRRWAALRSPRAAQRPRRWPSCSACRCRAILPQRLRARRRPAQTRVSREGTGVVHWGGGGGGGGGGGSRQGLRLAFLSVRPHFMCPAWCLSVCLSVFNVVQACTAPTPWASCCPQPP